MQMFIIATTEDHNNQTSLERWGWASIIVNLCLIGINLMVAYASDSIAVAAEMFHNTIDLVASLAVLVGLKLSKRQSQKFPYGLYKVESVVSAGIAVLISLTAYEIVKEVLFTEPKEITVTPWIIGGVVASILIPLIFSYLELRVGRETRSPCLIADAKEYRTHVLTSGVVLVSLLGHSIHVPIDKIAAAIIAVVIIKTGWSLLKDAMRVLLDASLKPETLAVAREILEGEPRVKRIHSLIGRNAGRYLFLEIDIEVKALDLKQISLFNQKLERQIRKRIPHLERVRINATSANFKTRRLALPLTESDGALAEHFGVAPAYLIVERKSDDGIIVLRSTVENPYSDYPRGRGIQVAHWLINQKIDALVTLDDITDKAPGHTLGEAGIEVLICQDGDVSTALDKGWNLLETNKHHGVP